MKRWLTDINNVNNLNQPGGGPIDLFAYKINYNTVGDDINGQVKPQFNGNISETLWRTAVDNVKRKYGYSYDGIHRLTAAHYQLPDAVVPRTDRYSTKYSYDENGNIHTLERKGRPEGLLQTTTIDDLRYSYDQGNRLLKVKDLTNNVAGFNPGTAGPNEEYTYDSFGNLKSDPYKKITNITYNHLNLPVKIQFQGGANIEYTYAADGTKLEKTASDTATVTTAYRDGFQYTDGNPEFFPHQEGYVKVNTSPFASFYTYVFNYTDHLGNIRLRYTQHPQTGETQILEEDHYYPFGLKHHGYNQERFTIGFDQHGTDIDLIAITRDAEDTYRYKFGGKEYQNDFDVNLYDFGARNYDPALGRWMNIDPLAEMMRRHSPYNYAFNNPVFFIDPDGMQPIPGALKSGLLVQNTSFLGVSDVFNGSMGSTSSGESLAPEKNNSAAYKGYFQQVSDYAANADVSLDGGGCPQGKDCDENKVSIISGSEGKVIGGHVFSSLELAIEKSTEYIVKGIFDKFGWNKDYQDGTILAASLFFSRRGSSKVVARGSTKLLNQFNSAESLIQGAGNLTKVKAGMQGFVKGDGAAIFKSISQGGTRQANGTILMKDGTTLFNHFSAKTGVYTIDINKAGQIYKIRITP